MEVENHSVGNEYVINHYRHKKVGNNHLLTTDYGSWLFLTNKDYSSLKNDIMSEELLSLLKSKGFVLTEENISKVIEAYRKKCTFLFQGTSLHIVIPTLRCNQKCIYCHANSQSLDARGYDMTPDVAKKAVDFIFQTPSRAITVEFQGGEPLIRFDIVKYIVTYAKEKNKEAKKDLRFKLVTNLTMMNDNILNFIIKEKIGLCTSLDGFELVHNKNRGDYKKVVGWIKRIKKVYPLNAMMLVTKYSLSYPKEIIDEYMELGFRDIWIKPANQLGFAIKNRFESVCVADEFLDFWKKSLGYLLDVNKKTILRENFSVILLKKILGEGDVLLADLQSPCGAAISQLVYNYDGNVYTCDEGRQYDIFRLGSVDNTYSELLTSKDTFGMVMASMTDSLLCDNCVYKPYCGVCPVCSYAETGNVVTRFPNRRCDILKGMFDYVFEKLSTDNEYKEMFLKWHGNFKPIQ